MSTPVITDFKDTIFQVSTGFGTPAAVETISNATEAVVEDTAHGLTSGAVVLFASVGGMVELNGLLCVIEVIDVDSFKLIGVDSTNWGVWTSGGTYAAATFSASCQVTGYNGASGTTAVNTVDTNCGSAKSYGVAQHGQVSITYIEAPTAFVTALQNAQETVGQIALKTTLPKNRGISVDLGTVVSVDFSGQANGNWTGGATIERDVKRVKLAA